MIIVMEMTADRSMIMPLFIAAIVADWVSGKICHTKLYHALSLGFRPVLSDKVDLWPFPPRHFGRLKLDSAGTRKLPLSTSAEWISAA